MHKSNLYDFLFELTEESENEGEQILVEESCLESAYESLAYHGFKEEEVRYICRMSVLEGEMLGLDTY